MKLFNNKPYEILFITGKKYSEELLSKNFPSNVKVVPYIENLPGLMKNTDLMISRAGASTLSEIIALKVPSILIPSPYVTDNHQFKNAYDLVSKKAAVLIEETDLNGDFLVRKIDELFENDKLLTEMKNNLELLEVKNSALKVVSILEEIVRS